ncbi:hypothetical protein D1872_311790 [compost metagenome]
MACQNHFRAVFDQILDRRQRFANPGIVGNLAVLHRHIEIHADKHAFAGYFHITYTFLVHLHVPPNR